MSDGNDDQPQTELVPYSIGYGKPPSEHRFQKGRSGNPNGRPRKAKQAIKSVDTGFGMRAAEEFLRLEAYRPVTVREGENVIELPAIQAVFRAMGVAAMKGNRLTQKMLVDLVSKVEAEHAATKLELLDKSFDYKIAWEREIERCRQAGLPEPQPVPHPDDMILDLDRGEIRIEGPRTKEQKERLDEALERRKEAQDNVNYWAHKYRRSRNEKFKAFYFEEWHWEQRLFDVLNEIVPKRYKAKLENRSYAQGASVEGKALEELKRNRKLRSEYVG